VIDFGIAQAVNQRLTEKTLYTRFAQMIGTPAYMSPEQAEMTSIDVDTRTDVYSLGVLLYELLTGTTPLSEQRLRTLSYVECADRRYPCPCVNTPGSPWPSNNGMQGTARTWPSTRTPSGGRRLMIPISNRSGTALTAPSARARSRLVSIYRAE
jgi:serine/threonine protein kinase